MNNLTITSLVLCFSLIGHAGVRVNCKAQVINELKSKVVKEMSLPEHEDLDHTLYLKIGNIEFLVYDSAHNGNTVASITEFTNKNGSSIPSFSDSGKVVVSKGHTIAAGATSADLDNGRTLSIQGTDKKGFKIALTCQGK